MAGYRRPSPERRTPQPAAAAGWPGPQRHGCVRGSSPGAFDLKVICKQLHRDPWVSSAAMKSTAPAPPPRGEKSPGCRWVGHRTQRTALVRLLCPEVGCPAPPWAGRLSLRAAPGPGGPPTAAGSLARRQRRGAAACLQSPPGGEKHCVPPPPGLCDQAEVVSPQQPGCAVQIRPPGCSWTGQPGGRLPDPREVGRVAHHQAKATGGQQAAIRGVPGGRSGGPARPFRAAPAPVSDGRPAATIGDGVPAGAGTAEVPSPAQVAIEARLQPPSRKASRQLATATDEGEPPQIYPIDDVYIHIMEDHHSAMGARFKRKSAAALMQWLLRATIGKRFSPARPLRERLAARPA